MLDEHVDILALEAVQFTIHQSQVAPVAVTTDSTERTESSQLLGHFDTTYIPRMPYFVTGFEVVQVLLVPIAVRITDNTYFLQIPRRLRI